MNIFHFRWIPKSGKMILKNVFCSWKVDKVKVNSEIDCWTYPQSHCCSSLSSELLRWIKSSFARWLYNPPQTKKIWWYFPCEKLSIDSIDVDFHNFPFDWIHKNIFTFWFLGKFIGIIFRVIFHFLHTSMLALKTQLILVQ